MKPTAYDRVPYKSAAVYHAHPNRLAALAMLFGMKPADIRNCRILELGCGEGTNLISIAYGLPQSELTGIDMAGSAVARGQKMIRELELKNITLLHRDISEPWPETGKFDYIIAHGVFSWVPQAVQEKILSLCKNNLSEQGIAYISFNAYPGWHLSEISRNIMRFHTDRFPDPNRKAVQALAILKFVTESCLSKSGAYAQALSDELDIIGKHPRICIITG